MVFLKSFTNEKQLLLCFRSLPKPQKHVHSQPQITNPDHKWDFTITIVHI